MSDNAQPVQNDFPQMRPIKIPLQYPQFLNLLLPVEAEVLGVGLEVEGQNQSLFMFLVASVDAIDASQQGVTEARFFHMRAAGGTYPLGTKIIDRVNIPGPLHGQIKTAFFVEYPSYESLPESLKKAVDETATEEIAETPEQTAPANVVPLNGLDQGGQGE